MIRRFLLKFLLIPVLLAVLAVGAGTAWLLTTPLAPPRPVTLTVRPGEPLARVARELAARGVLRSAWPLRLWARWRGEAERIQAGRYSFSEPASPLGVLDRLVVGDVIQLRVTIPEGWTLKEIAERLAAAGVAQREDLLRLARDPAFVHGLDIDATSLEGYLFPETYQLDAGLPAAQVLTAMVREFRRHLTPELTTAAAAEGLNVHQLVTLASIVQKEAGNAAEMPLIAAVFRNRLRRGMPLQADPTVIYGLPHFDGNLTRADLERPTPYNTYRISGLPPGPIASPGDDALQAVAHPAAVDYLYFVAKGDGSHYFSTTLAQHNRAVRRYQLHR